MRALRRIAATVVTVLCASFSVSAAAGGNGEAGYAWLAAAVLSLIPLGLAWVRPVRGHTMPHDHSLCVAAAVGRFVQATEPLRQAAVDQVAINEQSGMSSAHAQDMAANFYEAGLTALVGGGDRD